MHCDLYGSVQVHHKHTIIVFDISAVVCPKSENGKITPRARRVICEVSKELKPSVMNHVHLFMSPLLIL